MMEMEVLQHRIIIPGKTKESFSDGESSDLEMTPECSDLVMAPESSVKS